MSATPKINIEELDQKTDQEVQDLIIEHASSLENSELYALTARLTESVRRGSQSPSTPRGERTTPMSREYSGEHSSTQREVTQELPTYIVLQKAVVRQSFDLTSEALDVLYPGDKVIPTGSQLDTEGNVRLRCGGGGWVCVVNRSGVQVLEREGADATRLATKSCSGAGRTESTAEVQRQAARLDAWEANLFSEPGVH